MPTCPATLTPVMAFTMGITVRAQPSATPGAPASYPPFRTLRKVDVFLGNFLINGTNLYGARFSSIPVLRVPRGVGIRICALNDAVDLVLHMPGYRRWAQPWSPFAAWMAGSAPLDIALQNLAVSEPTVHVPPSAVDAFGQDCVLPQ